MPKLIGVTVVLALFGSALLRGQDSDQAADRPSNGVLGLTLSPVLPLKPGPPPRGSDRREDDIWRGEIKVTLRNLAEYRVHLIEGVWWKTYRIEVLDPSGKPVPLTQLGQEDKAPRGPHVGLFSGPVSISDLEPSEESSRRMNLALIWQVQPGQAYTIKVKRAFTQEERAFTPGERPYTREPLDPVGKPIEGELSATLEIAASPGAGAR